MHSADEKIQVCGLSPGRQLVTIDDGKLKIFSQPNTPQQQQQQQPQQETAPSDVPASGPAVTSGGITSAVVSSSVTVGPSSSEVKSGLKLSLKRKSVTTDDNSLLMTPEQQQQEETTPSDIPASGPAVTSGGSTFVVLSSEVKSGLKLSLKRKSVTTDDNSLPTTPEQQSQQETTPSDVLASGSGPAVTANEYDMQEAPDSVDASDYLGKNAVVQFHEIFVIQKYNFFFLLVIFFCTTG